MKKRRLKFSTDFLLPRNNMVVGAGSVLNLSGSYFKYKTSKDDIEADLKALNSDWINVGEDIKRAIHESIR